MSEEVRQDLEDRGFLLIRKIHIWLMVFAMLFAGMTQVVLSYSMLKDHETRIIKLESSSVEKHDLINEISYNLRNYMEANGQRYIKVTDAQR